MKITFNIIFFAVIFINNFSFIFALNDSLQIETNKIESLDSLKPVYKDTIVFFKPLKIHGSISNNKIKPYFNISKDSVLFSDFTTFFDIFCEKMLIYPLNLGNYANLNSFSLMGGFPNGLSFRFNGRSINDFQFPLFNFEIFPVEYFENVEILTGSDAIIFSDNSSTSLINFQEKIYNTYKPYTKIWFSQAAYEYLASDGTFSQNFMPNVNFTIGYRRMSVKGRFDNTWMDSWNLRGGLRWNINENTNITFSDIFTNHGQGTNGGIIKAGSQDIFDELLAFPRYDQLNERVFKHDITLNLTTLLNGYDSSDSTKSNHNSTDIDGFPSNKIFGAGVFSSSLYFSHSEWHQKRQEEIFLYSNDSAIFTKKFSVFLGINSSIDLAFNNVFSIKAGSEINYLKIDEGIYYSATDNLNWSLYGHFLTNPFAKRITISGGLRTGVINNHYFLNTGSKFNYSFDSKTDMFIDFSKSDRIPTPAEGLNLSKETVFLFLCSFSRKYDDFSIFSDLFYRQTQSPIISEPVYHDNTIKDLRFINEDKLTGYGLSISLDFSLIKNLKSKIKLITQRFFLNENVIEILPLFYPTIDTYYEISRGRSYIRLGLNASLIPSHSGMHFNPIRRNYIFNEKLSQEEQEVSNTSYNGINIYASARLGTVYVNISLQNILSADYYILKLYPMFNRNLRISLHWAFED